MTPVVETCRRLLKLKQRAGTPAEAQAAAVALARLLDKHRLSLVDIEAGADSPIESCVVDMDNPLYAWGKRVAPWKRNLAIVLCDHWGVAQWERYARYTNGDRRVRLCLCGRPSDVALVREFFAYLVGEALQLSVPFCKGRGRAYATSWLRGFVRGLYDQLAASRAELKQEAAAEGKQGAAMVLWVGRAEESAEALRAAVPKIKDVRSRASPVVSREAFGQGYVAGKTVHVGRTLHHSEHQEDGS